VTEQEQPEPSHRPSPAAAAVRYPAEYTWLVLVASLDLMFTWVVLHQGGREMNALADTVIDRFGLWGLSAFKFGIVAFVICLCEIVGRQRHRAGRFLAAAAIGLNCVPVLMAIFLLLG
jgi:hypothetical protein